MELLGRRWLRLADRKSGIEGAKSSTSEATFAYGSVTSEAASSSSDLFSSSSSQYTGESQGPGVEVLEMAFHAASSPGGGW